MEIKLPETFKYIILENNDEHLKLKSTCKSTEENLEWLRAESHSICPAA